jgi:hypothetical protein
MTHSSSATDNAVLQRQKRNRKWLWRVIGIGFLQYLIAFYSWSLVPGNAAPGAGIERARIVWAITKFPLFYVFGRQLMFFDSLLIADAIIWGVVLGSVLSAFTTRQSSDQGNDKSPLHK